MKKNLAVWVCPKCSCNGPRAIDFCECPCHELYGREDLMRRLCCDLANDAASFAERQLAPETVIARLFGYAKELAEALEYDGPKTLREHLDHNP